MSEPNTNCLEGMKCPKCGSLEPFRIEVTTTAIMYDEGSDYDKYGGDLDWEDESYCKCMECDFEGAVKDFKETEQELFKGMTSDRSVVKTTEDYWDCDCERNFIHPKSCKSCPVCGAEKDEHPDSRVNEVKAGEDRCQCPKGGSDD